MVTICICCNKFIFQIIHMSLTEDIEWKYVQYWINFERAECMYGKDKHCRGSMLFPFRAQNCTPIIINYLFNCLKLTWLFFNVSREFARILYEKLEIVVWSQQLWHFFRKSGWEFFFSEKYGSHRRAYARNNLFYVTQSYKSNNSSVIGLYWAYFSISISKSGIFAFFLLASGSFSGQDAVNLRIAIKTRYLN